MKKRKKGKEVLASYLKVSPIRIDSYECEDGEDSKVLFISNGEYYVVCKGAPRIYDIEGSMNEVEQSKIWNWEELKSKRIELGWRIFHIESGYYVSL